MRVSGGHLCEAKAPTEPAGENLNLRLPLAVPKIFFVLERRKILTAAPFRTRCIVHRTRSSSKPDPLGGQSAADLNTIIQMKKAVSTEVETAFLVRVTGCGCPVDTFKRSLKAPTEPAGETLNLRLPLAVPKIFMLLGASQNFDRCDFITLPLSATGSGRAQSLTPPWWSIDRRFKYYNSNEKSSLNGS